MSEVEAAIRAWEESRALMKGAMAAWEVARGGPEVWDLPRSLYAEATRIHAEAVKNASDTTLAVRDMALRALEAAEDREAEARHEAARLMPSEVCEGRNYEEAEGVIVDGRFYFRYDNDEIHSMGIANLPAESPPSLQPAEEPDGDWKRCDMTCPGCKEAGHVFSRIWESPRDGYKDMRYECRNCGDAWPVGRAAP